MSAENNGVSRLLQEQRRRRRGDQTAPRTVPGFSVQAYQKDTVTARPEWPRRDSQRTGRTPNAERRTNFAVNYGRADFPLTAVYNAAAGGRRFQWLVPFESIDYGVYMPILADGLRERPRPYGACGTHGLWDLLARDETGDRVLSGLPATVVPLRRALDAGPRDWPTVVRGLKTLQKLTAAGTRDFRVGRALVPYYRQLLPPVGGYLRTGASATSSSDGINTNVAYNVTDLCAGVLSTLQYTGGPDAYKKIKYVIPTYERV